MPGPRQQPTPTGPASEVPYMLAIGAAKASSTERRTSGSSGSLVLMSRLGNWAQVERAAEDAADHEQRSSA